MSERPERPETPILEDNKTQYRGQRVFTKRQGRIIINNTILTLKTFCERFAKGKGIIDNVGILSPARNLIQRIRDIAEEYGEDIVGTALETVRNHTTFAEPWLYYDSRDESINDAQDDWVEEFLYNITGLSAEIEAEVEAMRKYREDLNAFRKLQKTKKQVSGFTGQKQLEKEYKKELRNLYSLINRRQKVGVALIGIKVPHAPKKITAGSIRAVQRTKAKIKRDYQYLGCGRYKGQVRK